jgi:hypothetical protein
MATINTGYTFVSGEIVTPTKLNDAVNAAQVSGIVNANISATAGIVDTKLATIATPGKVDNTATTATTANVPSAIVARDPNGDFTAGVITADLDGNAATATLADSATQADYATEAGNATTADSATTSESSINIVGGTAGQLVYQTEADTTGFLDSGSSGQILTSTGSGLAPVWSANPASSNLKVVNFDLTPPTTYTGTTNNTGPYNRYLDIYAPDSPFVGEVGKTFYLELLDGSNKTNGVWGATQIANFTYRISAITQDNFPYWDIPNGSTVSFRVGYPETFGGGPSVTQELGSFNYLKFINPGLGLYPAGTVVEKLIDGQIRYGGSRIYSIDSDFVTIVISIRNPSPFTSGTYTDVRGLLVTMFPG